MKTALQELINYELELIIYVGENMSYREIHNMVMI